MSATANGFLSFLPIETQIEHVQFAGSWNFLAAVASSGWILHIGGGEIPLQLHYTTAQLQCYQLYVCYICDKVANKHIFIVLHVFKQL